MRGCVGISEVSSSRAPTDRYLLEGDRVHAREQPSLHFVFEEEGESVCVEVVVRACKVNRRVRADEFQREPRRCKGGCRGCRYFVIYDGREGFEMNMVYWL